MDGQLSFATLDYAGKKKRTKRDVFLAEMAATVPWSVLEAVIAPPKEGPQGGRRQSLASGSDNASKAEKRLDFVGSEHFAES